MALELNNCCLGGSRWDVSRDKMSFQNLPPLLRVSIRKQQNGLITGGHLCTLLLLGGRIGTVTKPIHFLKVKIVLKLNHTAYCSKKVIWTSTKNFGPFIRARHCATTEVPTPAIFSSWFLNTQDLQSFKQLHFPFPQITYKN